MGSEAVVGQRRTDSSHSEVETLDSVSAIEGHSEVETLDSVSAIEGHSEVETLDSVSAIKKVAIPKSIGNDL